MKSKQRTLTLNDSAQASNPGQLAINYLRWFISFPQVPLGLLKKVTISSIIAATATWISWYILDDIWADPNDGPAGRSIVMVLVFLNIIIWVVTGKFFSDIVRLLIHIREHFRYGCVNPAIVVSQTPPLIAVATDLRVRDKPYPVVKILTQPLHQIRGGTPPIGTRLATVALYCDGGNPWHWVDFEPIVVNCVTDRQSDIDNVFRSIAQEDWTDLELGLQKVRNRYQPGLYFVEGKEATLEPVEPVIEQQVQPQKQSPIDFPIEQLQFVDRLDILQVVHQTNFVLQLQKGFPSARESWAFEWKEFQVGLSKEGIWGSVAVILALLGIVAKITVPFFTHPSDPKSSWVIWLLFAIIIGFILLYGILTLVLTPFFQRWTFDRVSGTLTSAWRSILLGNQTLTYDLDQFVDLLLVDTESSSTSNHYTLELLQIKQPGSSAIGKKTRQLFMAKVASSSSPDLEARLIAAEYVRAKVYQFMGSQNMSL